MFVGRVSKRVVVAKLSEIIVARIGVATLAIVELVADRVVVVALDANNAPITQYFQAPIGVRPECATITQAIKLVDTPPLGVVAGGGQGEVVAVDAAEAGDSLGLGTHAAYPSVPTADLLDGISQKFRVILYIPAGDLFG